MRARSLPSIASTPATKAGARVLLFQPLLAGVPPGISGNAQTIDVRLHAFVEAAEMAQCPMGRRRPLSAVAPDMGRQVRVLADDES